MDGGIHPDFPLCNFAKLFHHTHPHPTRSSFYRWTITDWCWHCCLFYNLSIIQKIISLLSINYMYVYVYLHNLSQIDVKRLLEWWSRNRLSKGKIPYIFIFSPLWSFFSISPFSARVGMCHVLCRKELCLVNIIYVV